MNLTELKMQKTQTRGFINADASQVVLTRTTKTKSPSGGYTTSETALGPQKLRIIFAGLPQTTVNARPEAVLVNTKDQLVGEANANMRVGDWFTSGGQKWSITEISSTAYRKVANLVLTDARA